jgi:hypothetical protein
MDSNFGLTPPMTISDKWKPITSADDAFELDELKRDISISDVKFAGRKHKPSALMVECITYVKSRVAASFSSFLHPV